MVFDRNKCIEYLVYMNMLYRIFWTQITRISTNLSFYSYYSFILWSRVL